MKYDRQHIVGDRLDAAALCAEVVMFVMTPETKVMEIRGLVRDDLVRNHLAATLDGSTPFMLQTMACHLVATAAIVPNSPGGAPMVIVAERFGLETGERLEAFIRVINEFTANGHKVITTDA